MNEISYHGRALLEGPQNFFKLTTGVTPSYGFFRMKAEDVTYILSTRSGAPGSLVLTDGTNTVTLYKIYLVKSASVSSLDNNVCDVILADERILWSYKYGTTDYNTYKTDRTIGTAEFELENLNGGSEWTFTQLKDALKSILGMGTLNFLPPSRKPRNVIGTNISGANIMKQFLIATNSYIACNLQFATPTYDILPVGEVETAPDIALFTTYSNLLHKGHTIQLNPLVQQGSIAKMLAAADPDVAPDRLLTYGSQVAGGIGNYYIPSPYAVFGDEENAAALGTIGNEVATEYAASFANTWRDNTYAGILPFKLNRAIHEIIWTSTIKGAFTQIKSFRPREEFLPKDLRDTLFTYQTYLLGAGESGEQTTNVRSAKIQAGGIPSNNTGPFSCKLLDSDGLETGDPISVYPRLHLGSNSFDSGDVHPNLAATDNISIFQDLNGEWYTTFTFEDTIDCVCTAP